MHGTRSNNDLGALCYGARSTLGPRQCAILHDMATLEAMGERMTYVYLRAKHSVNPHAPGGTWDRMVARGLVVNRARSPRLTAKGREVASRLLACRTVQGVGLVMTGQPVL